MTIKKEIKARLNQEISSLPPDKELEKIAKDLAKVYDKLGFKANISALDAKNGKYKEYYMEVKVKKQYMDMAIMYGFGSPSYFEREINRFMSVNGFNYGPIVIRGRFVFSRKKDKITISLGNHDVLIERYE